MAEPQTGAGRALDRFMAKVDKTPECWVWTGYRDRNGYGAFRLNGSSRLAHRASWELANGPIPVGMQVLHRCDRPSCVNPEHLFLGTNADNIADRMSKGRGSSPSGIWNPSVMRPERLARGERNGWSRLTAEMVVEARRRNKAGEDCQSIAASMGVHETTILRAVTGRSWAHV